jgi:hypothetical protein
MKWYRESMMKLIRILFACSCLLLFDGCSTIESLEILCLTNKDGEFNEVKRKDWRTRPQEPYFGKWQPPLYGVRFSGTDDLIIYPVIVSCSGSAGPAFLPIIPAPKAWNHPDYQNLFRFVYSGVPNDIRIEMVDDRPVDPQVVKKTKTYDGMTMVSLQLDESFVADGNLAVKLSYQGEEKILEFITEQFTSFRPLVFP